jgi:hypothetical protein
VFRTLRTQRGTTCSWVNWRSRWQKTQGVDALLRHTVCLLRRQHADIASFSVSARPRHAMDAGDTMLPSWGKQRVGDRRERPRRFTLYRHRWRPRPGRFTSGHSGYGRHTE